MNKAVLNWVKTSEYDIITAEAMFKTKRYIYVIFLCHLAVEKSLKAVVCKITQKIPPKTHDLFLLLKLSGLKLLKEHQLLVAHLNTTSIPTRYPEDISKLTKQYNSIAAKGYLNKTKKLLTWLKQTPELKK